ncbi:hypothetical protein DL769_008586 [Monosporascus sp. CRB-8-3]|nr:hypothetical protein DL769_008586 [Monosporascus sp. CRB-8-3]
MGGDIATRDCMDYMGFDALPSNTQTFFDKIETTRFVPTQEYADACLRLPPVVRHLEKVRYLQPIYLITSLKTATGGARSYWSHATAGAASTKVGRAAPSDDAVPAQGGRGIELTDERKTGAGWESSSDFVFALGVWKISDNRKTREVWREEYLKVAMCALERKAQMDVHFIVAQTEELCVEIGGLDDIVVKYDDGYQCLLRKVAESETPS